MQNDYLESIKKQFAYYKLLGEQTFAQVTDEQLFWQANTSSNSIAVIVQHLHGNMLSRWTDFLNSDGEKNWRKRDAEFEPEINTRETLLNLWHKGWTCFLTTLENLTADDLQKTIFIRNQGHSVTEAINRQLAHYPYHIGQIVFIGKILCDVNWHSLSIPKGNSYVYNTSKFAQPKHKEHFTNEFLNEPTKDE